MSLASAIKGVFANHNVSMTGPGLGPLNYSASDTEVFPTTVRRVQILTTGTIKYRGHNGQTWSGTLPAGHVIDELVDMIFVNVDGGAAATATWKLGE